jgi:hypothetical protein
MKTTVQKLIQQLRRNEQINEPFRMGQINKPFFKTYPEMIKKEKQETIKKIQHSEEHKRKISNSHKGMSFLEESKKIIDYFRGMKKNNRLHKKTLKTLIEG